MISKEFMETFYPLGASGNRGITFQGTISISNADLNPPATYGSNMMRVVTVEVKWMSSGVERKRKMSTYVAEYGVQNYVFGP
jgi:hypothetical protein